MYCSSIVDDISKVGICWERRRLLTVSVSVTVSVFVFVSKIGASGREVDESTVESKKGAANGGLTLQSGGFGG